MKIFYDENMPFAAELFARFGQVVSFAGRECHAGLIADADVLLVRSITRVDEVLLSKASKLKFVGTATIGTDHIDQAYLASRDIGFSSAPGCNAVSVAEYVLSAIKVLEQQYGFSLQDKMVGIVGAGNTGSRLADKLTALGVNFVLCDPPLQEASDPRSFVSYDDLLNDADILSFHVPLILDGKHPTYHLFAQPQLDKIKPDAVIINACRGEVLDNQVLLAAKQNGNANPLVLDVWEGEPNILAPLLPYADIATAHIAGYSDEGKAKGTFMLYEALCRCLGDAAGGQKQSLGDLLPASEFSQLQLTGNSSVDHQRINRIIHLVYDVRRDDAIFRQNIFSQGFDWIRKNYPQRREFSSLTVSLNQPNPAISLLAQLGFTTGE
ncbi:MAG: erythronate-4-phosphate dehydrogenase [Alteromonadaceae bacterium]|jgi:erythronate-4-phosphate dehydrogenase